MSKARKRHRQPWWKRKSSNRQKRKLNKRRLRLGLIKLVRFGDAMKAAYPVRDIGHLAPASKWWDLIRKMDLIRKEAL